MCPNCNIVCIWAGAIEQLALVHMNLTLSLDSHASKPYQVGDSTSIFVSLCHGGLFSMIFTVLIMSIIHQFILTIKILNLIITHM